MAAPRARHCQQFATNFAPRLRLNIGNAPPKITAPPFFCAGRAAKSPESAASKAWRHAPSDEASKPTINQLVYLQC